MSRIRAPEKGAVNRIQADLHIGLSENEIEERVRAGLVNQVTETPEKTTGQIVFGNIFTLFNLLNFVLALLVFFTGSYKNLLFMGVVISNTLIGIIQEIRAKQVLDKLDELKTEIKDILNDNMNLGDIKASLQTANHGNWLLCDGQAVSRTDYADLFELVGTNFGAGDGVTTFNIPDYRGKFLRGLGGNSAEDVYTTQEEGLPDHTHMIANTNNGGSIYTTLGDNYLAREGGGSATSAVSYRLNGTDTVANVGKTNAASVVNEIYGKSVHVTPVNQAVNYFIKAKED